VISGDTIIVGSAITDGPIRKEVAPGQVKGFDVKTGELKWSFNMIAQSGEYGADTWEDGANAYTGNANVWANMSVDEELGYVYLPGSTPTRSRRSAGSG